LSGSVESEEASEEKASGECEGERNKFSSGSHQGIHLSSNITIRESSRVNLEVGLAGIVVQIADGRVVEGSVGEVERIEPGG